MKYPFTYRHIDGVDSYTTSVDGIPFVAVRRYGAFTIMAWCSDVGGFRDFGSCKQDKRTGEPQQAAFKRVLAFWLRYHATVQSEVTL